MAGEIVRILSGTRSELGDVTVGIANVFERPERPGELSCVLVLPDGEQVIAAHDEVVVGGPRYRLLRFEEAHRGRVAVFERVAEELRAGLRSLADRVRDRQSTIDLPVQLPGASLAKALRRIAADMLAVLGTKAEPIVEWSEMQTEQTNREWNGGEVGPTTLHRWVAVFEAGVRDNVEASVSLEIVRWSPDEIYHTQVSAFWRNGAASGSFFARAEGTEPHRQALLTSRGEEVRRVLADALRAGLSG